MLQDLWYCRVMIPVIQKYACSVTSCITITQHSSLYCLSNMLTQAEMESMEHATPSLYASPITNHILRPSLLLVQRKPETDGIHKKQREPAVLCC